MTRQVIQEGFTSGLPRQRSSCPAQDSCRSRGKWPERMAGGVKGKGSAPLIGQCPTREQIRHGNHICFAVAAVHSNGMQLHEFACVILIRHPATVCATGALIQVIQHGARFSYSRQKVRELAKCMRSNDVTVVGGAMVASGIIVDVHIQVVPPETNSSFKELTLRDDSPQCGGERQIDHDSPLLATSADLSCAASGPLIKRRCIGHCRIGNGEMIEL